MTSPLRRAREEVAVNIAVTGFVSKLLPTETKNLNREMEALQARIKTQQGTVKSGERELKHLANTLGESSVEYQTLAAEVNIAKKESDALTQSLKEKRGELRKLSNANADALNKVRGFGIALGVSALALGGFGSAVVKVAGDVRELEILAFRTGTSIEFLQNTTRRFTAVTGNADIGASAAKQLAEWNNQINLLRTGQSNINLGTVALSGLNVQSLINADGPDGIRNQLVVALQKSKGDPRARTALQQLIGPELFGAILDESTGTQPTFNVPTITSEQQKNLRQINRGFGEFRVTLGATAQIATLGVGPAMLFVFKVINAGLSPIRAFIGENQTVAKVLGAVIVVVLLTIAVLSGFAIAFFIGKIIVTSFGITVSTVTGIINFFRISNLAALAVTIAWNTAGAIDIIIMKGRAAATLLAGIAMKGWAIATGIAIAVQVVWNIALAQGALFLSGYTLATKSSGAAHLFWRLSAGASLSTLIAYRTGLIVGAAAHYVYAGAAKVGAIATGIATAVQVAWNVVIAQGTLFLSGYTLATHSSAAAHRVWRLSVSASLAMSIAFRSGLIVGAVAHYVYAGATKAGAVATTIWTGAKVIATAVLLGWTVGLHGSTLASFLYTGALYKSRIASIAFTLAAVAGSVALKAQAVATGVATAAQLIWTATQTIATAVMLGWTRGLHGSTLASFLYTGALYQSRIASIAFTLAAVAGSVAAKASAAAYWVATFSIRGLTIASVAGAIATVTWTAATRISTVITLGWTAGLHGASAATILHTGALYGARIAAIAFTLSAVVGSVALKGQAVAHGIAALATSGWTVAIAGATAAQWALNVALTANPIGVVIVGIGLLVAVIAGAIFFIIKFRTQIWDFFQGWGVAVTLVLGPIGLLIIGIIQVIKYWEKLQSIGGAVAGFLGFGNDDGAGDTGRNIRRGSGPPAGGTSAYNHRETNTQYNTYNITGETNPERIADEVQSRQSANARYNVSSRNPRFALSGT